MTKLASPQALSIDAPAANDRRSRPRPDLVLMPYRQGVVADLNLGLRESLRFSRALSGRGSARPGDSEVLKDLAAEISELSGMLHARPRNRRGEARRVCTPRARSRSPIGGGTAVHSRALPWARIALVTGLFGLFLLSAMAVVYLG